LFEFNDIGLGKVMVSLNTLVTSSAKSSALINSSIEKMSSGKKINSAADNAAGLAIANRFQAQGRGYNAGIRNANDGISLLNVADSASSSIQNGLQRLRDLAIQSSNGILSDQDRSYLELEAQQVKDEISRVLDTTEFNGKKLLSEDQSINVQLNGEQDTGLSVNTSSLKAAFESSGFQHLNLSTSNGASSSLSALDGLLNKTSDARSSFGASTNRLAASVAQLTNANFNTSASRSRIEDADFATQIANLSKAQFQQEASNSLQVQANASQSQVLSLLLN